MSQTVVKVLSGEQAMVEFGRRFGESIAAPILIFLKGDLGAGKTTLARLVIEALGHSGEVPSPTFSIIQTYDDLAPPVVHADFYRLDHPREAEEIGLDDYRAGAALLAEWPLKAGGFAHEPACLSIRLEIAGNGRKAIVEPGPDWLGRWA